jgi:hypothetical protein
MLTRAIEDEEESEDYESTGDLVEAVMDRLAPSCEEFKEAQDE